MGSGAMTYTPEQYEEAATELKNADGVIGTNGTKIEVPAWVGEVAAHACRVLAVLTRLNPALVEKFAVEEPDDR